MSTRICQCGNIGVLYPGGVHCDGCRPFPLNPIADPALTLVGLRASANIVANPYLQSSTLNDDRAIASGKRRASAHAQADARRREAERKEARK